MENKATQTYDLDEKKRRWKINESDIYESEAHKEAQLLEELKKLPDFDRYPLPASWHKKYNLKPVEAVDMKTYLASGGIMKAITGGPATSYEFKEPQRNKDGSLKEVKVFLEQQDIGFKIVQKPADLSKPAFATDDT
jgi:hypothetical protein